MRIAGALLSGFLLTISAKASARPALEVTAECGSALEFESEITRRLGRTPLPATRVAIGREGKGYRLAMSVGDEERELYGEDCRELFRAAVVVAVAVAISDAEPGAKPAAREPRSRPASRERRSIGAGDSSASSLTANDSTLRGFVELGGGVTAGVVPGIVPSLALGAKLFAHRFGVALGARYVTEGSSRDRSGRGVEVSALAAELSALFQPLPVLETRVGLLALRSSGTGLGSPAAQTGEAWAVGWLVGVAVFPVQRGRFSAGAAAELEGHLIRSRFEILNYREVFQTPALGGSASLRLAAQIF